MQFDLDWSLRRWSELPTVEARIDTWEQIDQLEFIETWPLEEERLRRLEEYAANGFMTREQQARYEMLKRLAAQNRPIIQRLRAG